MIEFESVMITYPNAAVPAICDVDNALASNEIVMTTVKPVVTVLHCSHEPAHGPPHAT